MAKKLNNKVALVTGGSAGIGLAIAKLFVAEGAKVIITGRRETVLNKAVAEIGNDALGIQADSSSLSDLDSLYKTIGEKVGKIDIQIGRAHV